MKACMEVLMTVFCKGHVVDPMQFLDYRTMLNFTRLAKFDLQSQQDLREVWSRYKQGEFDFNTCAGPIANLFRILQSINWQWISPWSLVDSSNKTWLLPLPLSDKPGFAHAIREALRQREIARASGPQRLGVRLQPRADMQGVETGVRFAETRKLSMYLSDYDKGLLIAIVSGSFSTMERDFRHKTRGVASPFCPFGACANQQVLETRRHRWWECPAWEHLRPPWFRALRPQLDEFPQCFVQCAIGCSGYNGPALDLVQKVFLDILLAVNRHQNSFGSASQEGNGDGPPQVPPPAPVVRRRLRGKQSVAQQPDALPLQHPPECVTMDADRLSCSRCGRNVQRYHATSVRQFWESRCYANRGNVHLRAVARSVAVWNKTRAEHQGVVDQLAGEHGHPLIWAGEKYSSIRCTTCEWRCPLFDMIRQKKQYKTLAPICTGNTRQALAHCDNLKKWVAAYNSRPRTRDQKMNMHTWEHHPFSVFCKSCGIYLHKVPRGDAPHNKDNCGGLPDPWKRVAADHLASGRNEAQVRNLLDGRCIT